jgi:hypothetical protein
MARIVQGSATAQPGGPTVLASGCVTGDGAHVLASTLAAIDPVRHPRIAVDLRGALALDRPAVEALIEAWERRGRTPGSVQLLLSPGPVQEFLALLG